MATVLLLIVSNVFMAFAWYGHLKFRNEVLWKMILASWAIALLEYCFQVPANRIGSYQFTPSQLRILQEVIGLGVFAVFTTLYFKETLRWNYAAAAICLMAAAYFIFKR